MSSTTGPPPRRGVDVVSIDGEVGAARRQSPSLAEASAVWARIGMLSFGGPAAQIALMHRMLVEERGWLDERRFLEALSFCMLLPGPEAMQLATYGGWRMHGVAGGLVAGLLFVLPGALVILALAAVYTAWGGVPFVEALFLGVKAAVLVIVVEALLRISRRALSGGLQWVIAVAAFVAIFFLDLPFPLIVLAAAIVGALRPGSPATTLTGGTAVSAASTVRTVALWLTIWLVPLALLTVAVGADHVLAQIAWFFSKLAVVTFGGAYAVLAYMAQEAVSGYGWLEPGEMMDALGLAETTPGPLILVTEFVGWLAAFRAGGWWLGLMGAVIALWATFAPCFLWIFAGAPYVERIGADPRLKAALGGITAAVVGVIANLTVWFGLHVLFGTVERRDAGPLVLWTPEIGTLDPAAAVLAVFGGWLLLGRRWPVPAVLAASAVGAILWRWGFG